MSDALEIPHFLPNGMTLYYDSDFMRRLREGDATVGWIGDPNLGVYHDAGRIEIWRWDEEDGQPRRIVRSRPGLDRLDSGLLRFLAEHDPRSRRQYNVVEDVMSHNLRREAELRATAQAQNEENADRLHHALLKDIGAYEGGTTRRIMSVPEAPWKRGEK